MANNGLISVPSAHSVKETIDRFENDAKSKDMTIFARIDHAAGAPSCRFNLTTDRTVDFRRRQSWNAVDAIASNAWN
jgi:hypothetical protein